MIIHMAVGTMVLLPVQQYHLVPLTKLILTCIEIEGNEKTTIKNESH